MTLETAIALNRFGLGVRPGQVASGKIARNPKAHLLGQLSAFDPAPSVIRAHPSASALAAFYAEYREASRKFNRLKKANGEGAKQEMARESKKMARRSLRDHYSEAGDARLSAAVQSPNDFAERLVHFWSNHFAVSADKQPMPALAGLYENEAIRPNVSGKFVDLLLAAEKHPAMITYLDNQRSIGPGSTLAQRANRRRRENELGLNENLAREILELHTLGVDGGYTQADVTSFARVITGWSVGGTNDRGQFSDGVPGTFEFREIIHEPGSQRLLGKRYAQKGVDQGEAVLRDLASHPSTARFIATKLVRHFVSDGPLPDLVNKLSNAYLSSDGDLSSTYIALIQAEESWSSAHVKYKSPHDFLVSTMRAFNHTPKQPRFVFGALENMGQAPYRPGSPAGWPDTADQWGGADALYKRIEWSNTVARVVGDRINPVALGDTILGDSFREETRKAVSRAESVTQGLTLLLASPDFQRR